MPVTSITFSPPSPVNLNTAPLFSTITTPIVTTTEAGDQYTLALSGNGSNFFSVTGGKIIAGSSVPNGTYNLLLTATDVIVVPGSPILVSVSANGDFSLTSSWTIPTGSGTLVYHVEQSLSAGSGFVEIGTTNTTTFTATGLAVGTNYFYRVRAISDAGTGSYSGVLGPTMPRNGNVVSLTKVSGTADPAHAFNVIIMGDGFTSAQQASFNTGVTAIVNFWLSQAPFPSFASKLNFYRLNVNSLASGVGNDQGGEGNTGSAPLTVSNYFGSAFIRNPNGTQSRGMTLNSSEAVQVATTQLPNFSMALVVGNTTTYGGIGGSVAVCTLNGSSTDVAVHETGHTAFDLSDEYGSDGTQDEGGSGGNVYTGGTPLAVHLTHASYNTTNTTVRANIPWTSLILAGTAIPTVPNPDCTNNVGGSGSPTVIGEFESAQYWNCGLYRGQQSCKMRVLGVPFCAVCQARITSVLSAIS